MRRRSIRQPRLFRALAAALVAVALTAPTVQAADGECCTRGADIIREAYPTARNISERTFRVGRETTTLPANRTGNPHELTCKTWPARPELMLVAVPLVTSQSEDGNQADVELLVVDYASLMLRPRLRLANLLTDDASFVSGLAFDIAYYRLSGHGIAFGLRIERRGSLVPTPFCAATLWLFVLGDNELKLVLDNLVVAGHEGEWDVSCAGEFQVIERTPAMGRPTSSGYPDILVPERKTKTISALGPNGECAAGTNTIATAYRLLFQGATYHVPENLRRIE